VRGVFLQDMSFDSLWPQIWPMMIIALVTLSMAGWLFRHRTD
jgi:ABC-2 type transport system permease protein